MNNVRILSRHFTTGFYAIVDPVGRLLEAIHVHPHVVTTAGFFFSIISGLLFWKGYFVAAGIFLIVSGACDVLDGRLARSTQRNTPFGALYDSTIDRYSEIAVYMGLIAFFDSVYISLLIILAIAGSLLTSYARARAEGLRIECKIGLMQRPERITFLAVAAILGGLVDSAVGTKYLLMKVALLLIAALANITVLQRVIHVRKELRSKYSTNP
jgi:CDP-diacylglycerol--glycerol-3-phosphate 3-phosphatidyltransferase